MWRWISGIPRAIRQHLHGPRASATNVCADDETEETKNETIEQKDDKDRFKHFTCRANLGSNKEDKSEQGPDHEKTFHNQQFCDFWSLFHNRNCALEALGWGAAVVLGIQLAKHPHWTRQFDKDEIRSRNNCLLYKVVHALPPTITKRSVIDTDKKLHVDENTKKLHTDEPKVQKRDSLTDVMNEFQSICKKYTSVGKNVEGLLKAKKGEYRKAADSWKEASQLGYVKSQYNLGLCYEVGKGVPKNLQEAVKHYKLAGEEGHPQALYNMALIYLRGGSGIEKDPALAISLLENAAQQGLTQAQTYLGVHYTEAETQDLEKAVSFFRAASDQNDPEAQYFLGICYEQGWGVDINECKAADLYAQAASSGHDSATYNLAVFHYYGLGGLPEDHVGAKELFEKAATAGNENAKLWLETPDIEHGEISVRDQETDTVVNLEDQQDQRVVIRMNSSTSSPSLTEYVRKHLEELEIGSFPQNFNILGNAGFQMDHAVLPNSVYNWQPQYGSPKLSLSPPPEPDQRVLFSLGADEDDLDALNGLQTSLENVSWDIDTSLSSHHFCSMIQRNSTMPNLQTISCT